MYINRKELKRQTIHMITGLTIVFLLYLELIDAWSIFVLLIVASILSFLSVKFDIPILSSLLQKYERSKDLDTFPGRGPILMLVGILLALKLFPQKIAFAAIMFLALGDSLSHLFGEHFGARKNFFNKKGNKLIEGTFAGTVAGALGAMFFVAWYEALLGAFVAMAAEALEIEMNKRPIDDNIIVPLVGGTVILLLRSFLG